MSLNLDTSIFETSNFERRHIYSLRPNYTSSSIHRQLHSQTLNYTSIVHTHLKNVSSSKFTTPSILYCCCRLPYTAMLLHQYFTTATTVGPHLKGLHTESPTSSLLQQYILCNVCMYVCMYICVYVIILT